MSESGPVEWTDATRLTVYLTEDDRHQHRSLAELICDFARDAGIAGVTVWRGIEGFGATGRVRAERLPDLARGLPLVVEVIDTPERVAAVVPGLRALVGDSLVTLESARVVSQARPSPA